MRSVLVSLIRSSVDCAAFCARASLASSTGAPAAAKARYRRDSIAGLPRSSHPSSIVRASSAARNRAYQPIGLPGNGNQADCRPARDALDAGGRRSPPMPINKPHLEFHRVDMSKGWETPEGYPTGIEQKILAGVLDERGKTGGRTRLLRFQPGVY